METVCSNPVCIPDREEHLDLGPCSFEGSADSWQDLERYWGDQKHRVHQQETQLSSSLEEHLLYDDCLNKPCENFDNSFKNENTNTDSVYVRGEDVKDIPTSYVLKGFQPHEFPVIGTYIDRRIVPGFKYRVRQNITNKYFFGGQAQFLEQIGLGYGKRLTFASKFLNKNENYFWSDSSLRGFGFAIEAVAEGDRFSVVECQTSSELGYAVVTSVEEQAEIHSNIKNNGDIEKEVKVVFTCDVNIGKEVDVHFNKVTASGVATLAKEKGSRFAKVKVINLDSFVTDNCQLQPDDAVSG